VEKEDHLTIYDHIGIRFHLFPAYIERACPSGNVSGLDNVKYRFKYMLKAAPLPLAHSWFILGGRTTERKYLFLLPVQHGILVSIAMLYCYTSCNSLMYIPNLISSGTQWCMSHTFELLIVIATTLSLSLPRFFLSNTS
jgi:hypothetical protein